MVATSTGEILPEPHCSKRSSSLPQPRTFRRESPTTVTFWVRLLASARIKHTRPMTSSPLFMTMNEKHRRKKHGRFHFVLRRAATTKLRNVRIWTSMSCNDTLTHWLTQRSSSLLTHAWRALINLLVRQVSYELWHSGIPLTLWQPDDNLQTQPTPRNSLYNASNPSCTMQVDRQCSSVTDRLSPIRICYSFIRSRQRYDQHSDGKKCYMFRI